MSTLFVNYSNFRVSAQKGVRIVSDFYKNYCDLCAKKEMSVSGVAAAIGMSNAAANGWKKGKIPNDTTLAKLSAYFGVSVDELLYGKKEKSPTPEGAELTETQQKAWDLIIQLDETSLTRFIKVLEAFSEGYSNE